MTKEQAIEEINKAFEPAFANYIITALAEGVTISDKALEQPTCDDCVSRQAVIEYIKASGAELGHDCENEDVREDILNMPPVTPIQRWIPVSSKRLPKDGQDVLVYYEYFRYGDYNRMWPTYGVGFQYDGHWGGDVSGHKLNVMAWMPLPEPYEEKRGAENEEK